MASSASLRCGGDRNLLDRRFGGVRIPPGRGARSCSLPRKSAISASVSVSAAESCGAIERRDRRSGGEAVARERLDEWMRESVADIVRNLREGPLMAHVYRRSKRNDAVSGRRSPSVVVEIERAAEEEDWLAARGRWEAGEAPVPEGLIFVEELAERHDEDENESEIGKNDSGIDGVTKAWGVVIQGRGAECPPACYLLKTSTASVGSGSGCGFGCTHFCLVRVSGFRETTESQLKNCWLLQAQAQAQAQFRAKGP